MNLPDKLRDTVTDVMCRYLSDTDDLAIAVFDENLMFCYSNKCFDNLFSAGDSFAGRTFTEFLPEEERDLLPLEDDEGVSAYFTLEKTGSALRCRLYRNGSEHILLGTVTSTDDSEVFKRMTRLANEMTNLSRDLKRRNRELREAQSKIQTLSGIIPICMHCKEIRDDEGYWKNLEAFISEHSQAEFSHSICSKCEAKYYSDDQEK